MGVEDEYESVAHRLKRLGTIALDKVKYLVEYGARVYLKIKFGRRALEYAAVAGCFDLLKYLMENGECGNAESIRKALLLALEKDVKCLLEHDGSIANGLTRPREGFLGCHVKNALSRIDSLQKDLLSANEQNDSLKAKWAQMDEVIEAQQEELNKHSSRCREFKKEALMATEGNVQRKMQNGEARKKNDENRSNSVEESKNFGQSTRSEAAEAGQIDVGKSFVQNGATVNA